MAKHNKTVLVVHPNEAPKAVTMDISLKTLQKAVDGYIEAVYPFEDPVALICNEEGKPTKRQTKWHMDEEQFHELQRCDSTRNTGDHHMNDTFVAFEMGKLWVEIEHTLDPDNWLVYPNVYALGIDGGYGETPNGGIPYDITDIHFDVRTALEARTFDRFKQTCERLLLDALETPSFKAYRKLAYEPLGVWE